MFWQRDTNTCYRPVSRSVTQLLDDSFSFCQRPVWWQAREQYQGLSRFHLLFCFTSISSFTSFACFFFLLWKILIVIQNRNNTAVRSFSFEPLFNFPFCYIYVQDVLEFWKFQQNSETQNCFETVFRPKTIFLIVFLLNSKTLLCCVFFLTFWLFRCSRSVRFWKKVPIPAELWHDYYQISNYVGIQLELCRNSTQILSTYNLIVSKTLI